MRRIAPLLAITLLAGCGFDTVPRKMDQTNAGVDEMNGKMDETNGGLEKTNEKLEDTNTGVDGVSDKLDQTNAGLGGLSTQVGETNTGVAGVATQMVETNDSLDATNISLLTLLDEMRATNAGLGDLSDQMATTNAAVHSQVLLLSLQEMTKPENTQVLFPPIGMMPAGQKFASEAKASEVLELTHAWVSEIELATLDVDSLRASGLTEAEITRKIADLDRTKQMKLAGLQIIASFMPQERAQEVAHHVATYGRYQRAGLAALYFRTSFVTMMLLDGGLFSEGLRLHGQMVEAVRLVAEIDYVGRLPFAPNVGISSGLLGDIRFEPKPLLVRLYGELDRRFASDLDPVYLQPDQTDPDLQRQAAELQELHRLVRESLVYWEARP